MQIKHRHCSEPAAACSSSSSCRPLYGGAAASKSRTSRCSTLHPCCIRWLLPTSSAAPPPINNQARRTWPRRLLLRLVEAQHIADELLHRHVGVLFVLEPPHAVQQVAPAARAGRQAGRVRLHGTPASKGAWLCGRLPMLSMQRQCHHAPCTSADTQSPRLSVRTLDQPGPHRGS